MTEKEPVAENEKIFVTINKKHKAREFFGILAGEWKKLTQEFKDEMRRGWQ